MGCVEAYPGKEHKYAKQKKLYKSKLDVIQIFCFMEVIGPYRKIAKMETKKWKKQNYKWGI